MKALIDVDILRYQIGSIQASHPYLEGEFIPAPESEIKRLVEDLIQHVIGSVNADSYICPISGKGNFRNDVAKQAPYKGNRDPNVSRPFHYDTVGDYIKTNHPHVVVDGMEADDWLGIEQRKDPDGTIICTRDKDMGTVFGWHYRWACGDRQPERLPHWISPYDAREFFFHQMLTGDNTDNIIGCGKKEEVMWGGKLQMRRKGVGEKAADKILATCDTVLELYEAVKVEYEKIFDEEHEEIMLENARLLYIGQTPDNLFNWDWLDFKLSKDTNNGELLSTDITELRNEDAPELGISDQD